MLNILSNADKDSWTLACRVCRFRDRCSIFCFDFIDDTLYQLEDFLEHATLGYIGDLKGELE